MKEWFISAPVVFLVILAVLAILNKIFSAIAYRSDKSKTECGESYACGEDNYNNMAQPDYSNFFPFAFFFTLAHVATLIITTVPVTNLAVLVMATIYIVASIIGLYILLRK